MHIIAMMTNGALPIIILSIADPKMNFWKKICLGVLMLSWTITYRYIMEH